MGQRYEKNRKSVSENKQTLERLHTDKDTLQKEYAPLSLLESIQGLLDDEATDAIQGVKAVGEFESQRIESETDTAEEEKRQITGEINSEIAKVAQPRQLWWTHLLLMTRTRNSRKIMSRKHCTFQGTK